MQVICLFSVVMALVALALVAFAYREPDRTGEPVRSMAETFRDMFRLFLDLKFVSFIVIFAGFDLMFWQLYLSVPTYIVTHISETAPMEYIVAINPGMIIVLQMVIASLVVRMKPIGNMALGMAISVVGMVLLGVLPTLWGAMIAIAVFAIGEMTFAPRFLDYVSTLAPKGKIGLYLGFAYMRAFIANLLGGPLAGYLLGKYCPADGVREPYKMWFTFAFIGVVALIALFVYDRIVGDQTEKEEATAA